MKYLDRTLFAVLSASLFSVPLMSTTTQAAVVDSAYERQGYIGLKAGGFLVDEDGFNNPIAYGAYAGYNLDPNFAVEIEYMDSNEADVNVRNGSGSVDVNTYGAYAAYRYYIPYVSGLYTKGRLGFSTTETDLVVKGPVDGRITEIYGTGRDTGVAGGLGLGYALNDYVKLETEYDFIDSDISLLTIGASLQY